jgi:hypothetical protein
MILKGEFRGNQSFSLNSKLDGDPTMAVLVQAALWKKCEMT